MTAAMPTSSLAALAHAAATQPAADTPVKIDVDALNFYYGDKRALHGISVKLHANVVSAFIGPSGCGKSTFLRTLNRMNDIIPGTRVEGRVLIDGVDIYDPKLDVVGLRRRVGMVFQKSNPFPKSIFDNVAYGLRINGMAASRTELHERVDTTAHIEELIYDLKRDYTIVIVTHNMQQAARVSDYTAFFWLGTLVEYDRTEKLFTAPAQKLTEDYVTGRFG